MRKTPSRAIGAAALILSGALLITGCTSTPSNNSSSAGKDTVTIYGTPVADEAAQWEASWSAWAAANNITIQYTGDRDFTSNISTKAQGNQLPDIAVFPQPGLMASIITESGKAQPLDDATLASVKKNFSDSWQSYGTVDGQQYAVPLDASAKGYIWYQPANFTKWGLSVPTSWADLMTATATIQKATGKAPWCVGFGSGDATGWPGTDQIAEYVLSAFGGDVYDQWVAGTVKFTDQQIADSFNALGKIWFNKDYVNATFGDTASINTTAFGDVAAPVAAGTCALTNQATFLEGSFASVKTAAGATPKIDPAGDVWAFMMPPVNNTPSMIGGGDFAVAFSSDPSVQKVMNYLASGDYATSLITVPKASFITANQGVDATKEADPLLADAIKSLTNPDATFRFGAGDIMPQVVQQAWWKGMIDWINGANLNDVLTQIQAAWANA